MGIRNIIVLPYDKKWKQDFLDIESELRVALGNLALSIEHVGSTSVEGLSAKPIIDIDVVVQPGDVDAAIKALAAIGYNHEGNLGIEGREAFNYSGKEHLREHHLYVCPEDSPELKRHLAFRDYLRSHKEAVEEYSKIKLEAAALYPHDIDGYIKHKSLVIEKIYFDIYKKKIGTGAQAEVFLYDGFAYKVYRPGYPAEWIAFEKEQQATVNKAGLCPVKYYETGDSHVIKMDFVDGITLEKRMNYLNGSGDANESGNVCGDENKEEHGYMAAVRDDSLFTNTLVNTLEDGFNLLVEAFRFVHNAAVREVAIPRLIETAGIGMSEEEKNQVIPIIQRLSEKYPSCICHLDMHFLNIMLLRNKNEYTIIDWMNARLAPAVFDYARTYVIFVEFAKEVSEIYRQLIWPDIQALGISEEDFYAAVEACTVIRKQEKK